MGTRRRRRKKREPEKCHLAPGARADLPPMELFFDPLLVVIMQLINVGAVIPKKYVTGTSELSSGAIRTLRSNNLIKRTES